MDFCAAMAVLALCTALGLHALNAQAKGFYEKKDFFELESKAIVSADWLLKHCEREGGIALCAQTGQGEVARFSHYASKNAMENALAKKAELTELLGIPQNYNFELAFKKPGKASKGDGGFLGFKSRACVHRLLLEAGNESDFGKSRLPELVMEVCVAK